MKIGQFSESFLPIVDGVGRVVYSYADILSKMGHECYVITPESSSGYRGKYPFEIVDFYGVQLKSAKQYKTGVPTFDFHYGRRIKNIEFDILHSHSPFLTGEEAYRLKKKRGIPLISTFHSKYYDDFYKATGAHFMAEIGVKAIVNFYEKCDDVWAVSESTAQVLHSYGYDKEIFVMENGTIIKEQDDSLKKKAVSTYNLPEDKNLLLFVGQMNFKKNIKRVLEAFSILCKNGGNYHLVLAGQGPDLEDIKQLVSDLGIVKCVTFAGHIQDEDLLFGLYMAADLFVFPSLYDNAPLVVREAATMSTPSVVCDGSASAEIIKDGYNGFITKDDSEYLADLIIKAMSDKDELKRIGENARKTIPINWNDLMKKVVSRYEYVIDKFKPSDDFLW